MSKKVTLIRKHNFPFTVNYPSGNTIEKYIWHGTKGSFLDEREVPFEVYRWLVQFTTTISDGELLVKETDDEYVNSLKQNIENIENIEKTILTKDEVESIVTTGNQYVLKKKLNELSEDLDEVELQKFKRNFLTILTEIGVDSSAKRKVIADWSGINYENSDLILDPTLKEYYENYK